MSNPEMFPPTYNIQFTNGLIKCHRQNTSIWTFTDTKVPGIDHVYIDTSKDRHRPTAVHIFEREMMEANQEEQWYQLLEGLGRVGCETYIETEPSDQDLAVYIRKFGEIKIIGEVKEPEPHELTPRQQARVAWLEYMLDHDLLIPQTFHGEGALEI